MQKKLSKSQKKLIVSWKKELGSDLENLKSTLGAVANNFAAALNEIFNNRLEILARTELDIDLDEGMWNFDEKTMSFIEKKEVKEVIPSEKKKKKHNPTKNGS